MPTPRQAQCLLRFPINKCAYVSMARWASSPLVRERFRKMDTGAAALLRFIVVTLVAGLCAGMVLTAPPSAQVLAARICGGAGAFLRRHAGVVATTAIVAYAATFSVLSILQHYSLRTHAFDLGVYDQVIWNSAQGRWLELSLAERTLATDAMSYLGFHFSPTLALLVPFYWLYADPRVLLVLQSVLFASGAVPIYWLASRRLGRLWAMLFVFSYLSFPALTYANLFDFHSVALVEPMLSFALYYLLQRNYRVCLPLLLFAMLTKEDVGLIVAAFGAYVLIAQRRWRIGPLLVMGGLGWVYLATMLVIPSFAPERSYYYLNRYAYLGSGVPEIMRNLVSHPLTVVSLLGDPGRLAFLLSLLVPLGFASLLGIEIFLLALPTIGYLLLSGSPSQYSPIFHYGAVLVPLLLVAGVEGVSRALGLLVRAKVAARWKSSVPVAMAIFLAVSGLLSYTLNSRAPLSKSFQLRLYQTTEHTRLGLELVSSLPPEASVSAQSDLVPHLTRRRYVYLFPDLKQADYILLDRQGYTYPLSRDDASYDQAVAAVLSRGDYETVFDGDGYLLLRRAPQVAEQTARFSGGE
ncbi:MAG: DUF2079 domain-containing protein [Chloroflexota bacterium]|nr:MAG: DUF2079 domain-containing protein [Chloroflexota bacterium]